MLTKKVYNGKVAEQGLCEKKKCVDCILIFFNMRNEILTQLKYYTNAILTGNHLGYYSSMDSVIVGRKYLMNITYILSVLDMGSLPKVLVNGNIRENIFF